MDNIEKKAETVLIADDETFNRELLKAFIAKRGYHTIEADDGRETVEKAIAEKPDVILLDVMMPEMDGFEVTSALRKNIGTRHIPVIIVTTLDSRDELLKGISLGADDYLTKPIDLNELGIRLENNLIKKRYHDLLTSQNEILNKKVAEKTREIRNSFIETANRLILAAEYKDPDTGSHIRRISRYTRQLAEVMGLDEHFCETLYHASAMHDIGKVAIPDSILLKAGPLDNEEWTTIRTHTTAGAGILKNSESDILLMAEDIALFHHECWDGSGYPEGLSGEDIPLSARIMTVCDQYDALRSRRPYKPPLTHQETMNILQNGDGRTRPEHFDPDILEIFISHAGTMEKIFEELVEQS